MLCAVVPLMGGERFAGFRRSVVHKFVALAFGHTAGAGGRFAWRDSGLNPGFAAIVGALNDVAEPAAGLRGVNAVGVRGCAIKRYSSQAVKLRAPTHHLSAVPC